MSADDSSAKSVVMLPDFVERMMTGGWQTWGIERLAVGTRAKRNRMGHRNGCYLSLERFDQLPR